MLREFKSVQNKGMKRGFVWGTCIAFVSLILIAALFRDHNWPNPILVSGLIAFLAQVFLMRVMEVGNTLGLRAASVTFALLAFTWPLGYLSRSFFESGTGDAEKGYGYAFGAGIFLAMFSGPLLILAVVTFLISVAIQSKEM